MPDVYGMMTGKKSCNSGSSLYEFDRVAMNFNGREVTGTILNVCDPWYPEFKVLLDAKFWKNFSRPEYVALIDGEATLLNKTDKDFRIHRTSEDFMNYCKQYDYRGLYKNSINRSESV